MIILDIGDNDVVLAPITTREKFGSGDYKLRDWQLSGLSRESWVCLAKVSCLEKNDISLRLGHLPVYDRKKVAELWQSLYTITL